jgi:hypothetical protein
MNLVLWYNKIGHMNFYDGSRFIRSDSIFVSKLKRRNIPYQVKELGKDTINSNDRNLFVIELLDVDGQDNYFKDQDVSLLQGLKVVFYYPREGHELGNWYTNIELFSEKHDLDAYFVYSDIDIEYKAAYDYVIPVYTNYFVSEYYDTLEDLNMTDDIINLNVTKEKDFLCYNGKYRPARIKLVSDLYKLGLDNNFISCTGGEGTVDSVVECLDVLREYNLSDEYLETFVKNFKPIYLDKPNTEFGMVKQNNVYKDHYEKSYFSIVTETSMSTRFLTEKIYKPIFNKHPFVLLGADRMLDHLRQLGFYTFEEMFDETYDQEADVTNRYNKLLQTIVSFCNLSQEEKQQRFEAVKSKLEHNRNKYIQLAKESQQHELHNVLGKFYES